MIDVIEELYANAEAVSVIKEVIKKYKQRRFGEVERQWQQYSSVILGMCENIAKLDRNLANEIFGIVERACEHTKGAVRNYCLMADMLEQMIPLLYRALALFGKIDVDDGEYRIFSTDSGYLSIEEMSSNRIIHSTIDPVEEANEHASRLYHPKQRQFRLLGCGLGYLALALYKKSQGSIVIYIYDLDVKMINYAFDYGVLSYIPDDNIKIYVCDDEKELLDAYFEDHKEGFKGEFGYYCDEITYYKFKNKDVKSIIDRFNTINDTNSLFAELVDVNFNNNIRNAEPYLFRKNIICERWMVIGAGPSVDEQIQFIKDSRSEYKIVAVTTIYKRLLDEGINPDVIVALDPQGRTYNHMKDVDDSKALMCISATANWRFARYYRGDKCLVMPTGNGMIEEYCSVRNIEMWDVGSTVTEMAIEVAFKLGATEIALIGADLAYPGEKTHASGTMDETIVKQDGLLTIPSVDGGMVRTSKHFNYYREEIERKILRMSNVRIINYSNNGAFIKGTVWYKECK